MVKINNSDLVKKIFSGESVGNAKPTIFFIFGLIWLTK